MLCWPATSHRPRFVEQATPGSRTTCVGTGRHNSGHIEALVTKVLEAAHHHPVRVPGEDTAASIIKDLAEEALDARPSHRLDIQIAELLDRHPDAALIKSLPGMGAVLTAEFLAVAGSIQRFDTADQLAAAAGLAPVLTSPARSATCNAPLSGNKTLKRVFYQSAFCALQHDPTSRAYYARKRAEGKTHHQALIALARRRVDVLYAILR